MGLLSSLAFLGYFLALYAEVITASTFPTPPTGVTEFISQRWPGATISYKQTTVCETTPGVKAWSGYISMPAVLLNKIKDHSTTYDAHLFFWYFEARKDAANAPTAMYFGGGPGYTSLDSMSVFPCTINPDSNSTTVNQLSWNNKVNMLYIEQPPGTGFSYSIIQNGTWDVLNGGPDGNAHFKPLSDGVVTPATNATTLAASLDPLATVNTTAQAARIIWQFSQIFFQEFPEKPTTKDQISIWGTSYGGFWASGFFSHFITQNELVSNKSHSSINATLLPLGTLGIGNGCIDFKIMTASFPHMSYNNTYGIQVYNRTVFDATTYLMAAPKTGCNDLIDNCRALAAQGDPTGQGLNQEANTACALATMMCWLTIQDAYSANSNHSTFDIAQVRERDDVSDYHLGFFNQHWVQQDLGARVNFTYEAAAYETAMFGLTGDAMVQDKTGLEHAINGGYSVALIFGDRDYVCNWIGGEAISLATGPERFASAGYADLVTNDTYNGGLVRQSDRLSFSRVFEAPHAVAAGQPETVSRIFERATFGLDVATGKVPVAANGSYITRGPTNSWNAVRSPIPPAVENTCYVYAALDTCTPDQLLALASGTAVIRDFVVVEPRGWKLAGLTFSNETGRCHD